MERKFICPMHPEVVSQNPGSCPKCGMDLVEVGHTKEKVDHMSHEDHHQMMADDFKKRFILTLPLTLIVLILSPKIQEWFNVPLQIPFSNLLLFLFGTLVVVIGGPPFFKESIREIKSKNYGMMTLVSLAVLAGYFFSVAGTFFFPGESFYWEISTLVSAFLFGHWMEMRAVLGTGSALKELAKLIPPMAHKIVDKKGGTEDMATEKLVEGDLVLVKPGERIPVDGEVLDGESSVNEGMITGESRPVEKKKGDSIIGGTINNDGSLTVKVTKTGRETAISQIMELIRQAQDTKPSVQKLADKAANVLTLTAIIVGFSTFVYWFLISPQGIIFAVTLAITVVVIACPHALGLAIPTVTTITSGLAAKNGILIRDMNGLEIARKLQYVIFDKTGTLTKGEFGVSKIISLGNLDEKEILKLAAAVEVFSQHSIAKGILDAVSKRKISFTPGESFKSYPGKGAEAKIGNKRVILGNLAMLKEKGIETPDIKALGPRDSTGTPIWFALEKRVEGIIVVDDQIRDESKKAIQKLHELGVKTAMLTGDKKSVADEVARKLGIDTAFAEVLPGEKVDKIRQLQEEGFIVGMVGDGVNDAPSLTQAHLGIAIGAGTDVAIESAEIVLVRDNPLDIVKIINLSRRTNSKMRQNLAWATGYNILAIPAAAGVFYPLGIVLRPEWGALLMTASSIIVVFNALFLKNTKL